MTIAAIDLALNGRFPDKRREEDEVMDEPTNPTHTNELLEGSENNAGQSEGMSGSRCVCVCGLADWVDRFRKHSSYS